MPKYLAATPQNCWGFLPTSVDPTRHGAYCFAAFWRPREAFLISFSPSHTLVVSLDEYMQFEAPLPFRIPRCARLRRRFVAEAHLSTACSPTP